MATLTRLRERGLCTGCSPLLEVEELETVECNVTKLLYYRKQTNHVHPAERESTYVTIGYLGGHRGLGGLVVIHSAASANGPGSNSSIARAYLRFNSRASTLAGKQCLAMRCTVAHKL